MNRLWPIVSVAIAVVALAVVILQRSEIRRIERRVGATSTAGQPAGESTDGQAVAKTPSPAKDLAIERRVAALEQTVSRLFKMLIAAEHRGPSKGGAAQTAPPDLATLREDVDALLTGEALETDQGRKRLHEVIRQAQQEAWQEQRQQWRRWRQQAQRSRLKELGEKTGLNAAQLEQIGGMLDAERTQRRAVMGKIRAGEKTFDEARVEMRALRQQTDQKVRQLVGGGQYEAYEKMREERRGGPRSLR